MGRKKKQNDVVKFITGSTFFRNDDFFSYIIDEDAEAQLDAAWGGAKQTQGDFSDELDAVQNREPVMPLLVKPEAESPVIEPDVKATSSPKKPVVTESTLHKHILQHYSIGKFGNLPYIRRQHVWLPVSEGVVGALLMESLPSNLKEYFRSDLARGVARRILFDLAYQENNLVLPKHAMLFRNGCFDTITHEQIEPEEHWFFPFSINANFHPYTVQHCLVFDRFMNQISNHDEETYDLFMTFLAYCLMPGAPLKKLFVLGTAPDCGKSVLAEWLQHYVGEDQTTAIPLERFGHKFSIADIVGKSLVFSMELPSDPLPSKATIVAKNITGHDKIQVEQKHIKAHKYLPHAKIICGTNHPVQSDDLPFWRRILVLPCLNTIPPEAQDDDLLQKLIYEEEAIMVRIMEYARRFAENGMEFPYCAASIEMKREWRRNNVPHLSQFISERCVFDCNARCWSEDLYTEFESYCLGRGSSAPSLKAFIEAIKIGWPELKHHRWAENGRQGRGLCGIALR